MREAPLLERIARASAFQGYYADTEYNRMQEGRVKTILDEEAHEVRITCDLILHSRGEIAKKDNLIAIEMKRLEHPASEKRKDRIRLRTLTKSSYDGVWSADSKTLPEYVCGYKVTQRRARNFDDFTHTSDVMGIVTLGQYRRFRGRFRSMDSGLRR
jgi:hypothetical protein